MRLDAFGRALAVRVESAAPEAFLATYSDGTPLGWVGTELRIPVRLEDVDSKLPDRAAITKAKAFWTERLDALAAELA